MFNDTDLFNATFAVIIVYLYYINDYVLFLFIRRNEFSVVGALATEHAGTGA